MLSRRLSDPLHVSPCPYSLPLLLLFGHSLLYKARPKAQRLCIHTKPAIFGKRSFPVLGELAASTHYVTLQVSQLQSRWESEEKISKALDGVPGALVEISKFFRTLQPSVELSKALVALKPASEDAKAAPGDSKALVDFSTALVDLKAAAWKL